MIIKTEAVHEHGILRPVRPIPFSEGEQVMVIILSEQDQGNQSPAEVLARIAAMPAEGSARPFSGQDHDSPLYSQ